MCSFWCCEILNTVYIQDFESLPFCSYTGSCSRNCFLEFGASGDVGLSKVCSTLSLFPTTTAPLFPPPPVYWPSLLLLLLSSIHPDEHCADLTNCRHNSAKWLHKRVGSFSSSKGRAHVPQCKARIGTQLYVVKDKIRPPR